MWHPCDDGPDPSRPRVVGARAPVRVLDVGGWTDTWFAGHGAVCSVAVEPGVSVQVSVHAAGTIEAPIVIDAVDYGHRYGYDQVASPPGRHPMIEAAIHASDLPLNDDIALEVAVRSAVPPGSSLGTSASLMVALLAALEALTPGRRRANELVSAAHTVEATTLQRQSGVQDQCAAAYGGALWIEIDPYPNVEVKRLPLPPELSSMLHTVYLGRGHDSSMVHAQVIAELAEEGIASPRLARLRALAVDARESLAHSDLSAYGEVLKACTDAQAALHPTLVSDAAVRIIDAARVAGALGWKINGAGGDGGTVSVVGSLDDPQRLVAAAGDPGARLLDLRPSPFGVMVNAAS